MNMQKTVKSSWLLLAAVIVTALLVFSAKCSAQTQPGNPNLIFVEGGTFMMGSDDGDEAPIHSVTVGSFYISKYEVTVEEFKKFIETSGYETTAEKQGWSLVWNGEDYEKGTGINWRYSDGEIKVSGDGFKNAVVHVNWYDCIEYANWKSKEEGLTPAYTIDKSRKDPNNTWEQAEYPDNCKWVVTVNWAANGYRLPTEAEWEYAARGGNLSKEYIYSGSDSLDEVAWYIGSVDIQIDQVGAKKPNELGIYDMSGNVWEWCWDWYSQEYYSSSPSTNPTGPDKGGNRVTRGGSWRNDAEVCRVAFRRGPVADCSSPYIGFRLVRNP